MEKGQLLYTFQATQSQNQKSSEERDITQAFVENVFSAAVFLLGSVSYKGKIWSLGRDFSNSRKSLSLSSEQASSEGNEVEAIHVFCPFTNPRRS